MTRPKRHGLRPVLILPLGFLCIILLGAALLTLPVASNDGQSLGFADALFTATSATCVRGLIVRDTAIQFSTFGRVVIIIMIQVGGLGFMTLAAMAFSFFKVPSPNQIAPIAEAFGEDKLYKAYVISKKAVALTFSVELVGAIVLFIRFMSLFEGNISQAAGYAVFHSISAFCNAGFDLMGTISGPYSSFTMLATDSVVNITLMVLIMIGGLGFAVVLALISPRRKLNANAKIVLTMYLILFIAGAAATYVFEYTNPKTIGSMNTWEKLLASMFQSVTCRTAGFNTIDQTALRDPTKAASIALMFIGGAPAGTAGGVKVTTIAIAFMTIRSIMVGRTEVFAFMRAIKQDVIRRSFSIVILAVTVVFGSSIVISAFQYMVDNPVSYIDVLFESMSAMGTVGLTSGLTGIATVGTRIVLGLLMFLGRLGPLTLAVSVVRPLQSASRYVEENVAVG